MAERVSDIQPGDVILVSHPFCWDLTSQPDEDGIAEFMSWRPGVRNKPMLPDTAESVADGLGHQELTVVSVHKPGRFPARVFYTRQWIDPRGKRFGNGSLRIKTVQAFRNIVRGYRHEFRLTDVEELAEHVRQERREAALAAGETP